MTLIPPPRRPAAQRSCRKRIRMRLWPRGAHPSAYRPVCMSGTYRVVVRLPLQLIEFPADDPDRARRFWTGVLGVELVDRSGGEGEGWQTASGAPALGVHKRGKGPGDMYS